MRQRTGDATENEHIHVSASHVCTRMGLAYKGMERSSPFPCPLPLLCRDGAQLLPHLHRDCAHICHICTLPHRHQDLAHRYMFAIDLEDHAEIQKLWAM